MIDARFRPAPMLGNRHLQSLLASIGPREGRVRARCRAFEESATPRVLDCGDGVRLLGLYSPPPSASRARGLAILLHGWEGSARSVYLVSLGEALHREGWAVFRLNLRDHGQTHDLNEGLFHSCLIDEVVAATAAAADRWPFRPLVLAGFSLGGNFALRVALRAPSAGIPLERAIAVNPAINPANITDVLERGSRVYERYFMWKWRRSLRLKQAAFPGLYAYFSEAFDLQSLREMTAHLIPRYSEYGTLEEYFDGYTIGGERLSGLSVPSTLITAADDPIIPVSDVRSIVGSNHLDVQVQPRGGHCGFIEKWSLDSWIDRHVERLIAAPA